MTQQQLIKKAGIMTPEKQEQKFGESLYTKLYQCDVDKCQEVSSFKLKNNKHVCIEHYMKVAL